MKHTLIVVTAAIFEKNGLVLAARRREGKHLAGYWEFPGGKLENGESPEHCLARELKEEFDVETTVGSFFEENIHDYNGKLVRLLAYQVMHKKGEFKLIDHDKIEWLSPKSLWAVSWAPADIPLVEKYQALRSTQKYYSENAKIYCAETVGLNLPQQYQLFLSSINPGGHILDIGCGSGRDSYEFISRGFKVTAIDASKQIAKLASNFIGQPVKVQSFLEMEYKDQFEGVWASASLLHCTNGQFQQALVRALAALVSGGVMFLSVKKGETETTDIHGRHFNNYTQTRLNDLLCEMKGLEIVKLWESDSLARGERQTWVQALIKKKGAE